MHYVTRRDHEDGSFTLGINNSPPEATPVIFAAEFYDDVAAWCRSYTARERGYTEIKLTFIGSRREVSLTLTELDIRHIPPEIASIVHERVVEALRASLPEPPIPRE